MQREPVKARRSPLTHFGTAKRGGHQRLVLTTLGQSVLGTASWRSVSADDAGGTDPACSKNPASARAASGRKTRCSDCLRIFERETGPVEVVSGRTVEAVSIASGGSEQ